MPTDITPEVYTLADMTGRTTHDASIAFDAICKTMLADDLVRAGFVPDRDGKGGGADASIVLTINGIQVPLVPLLDRMAEGLDAEAEARARVLVETRVRRVTAIIEQIGRHATDHLRTLDEEEDES